MLSAVTLNVCAAGVGSSFPARSRAFTSNVCASGASSLTTTVVAGPKTDQAAASSRHAKSRLGLSRSVPATVKVAVVSGDPGKGAFSAFVEFPKGTNFPRHYHDADTYGYLVKGAIKITMADGQLFDLKPGGALMVPAKAIHTTESKNGAVAYQYSNGPETTVMVDEKGNPLPPPAPAPTPVVVPATAASGAAPEKAK